MLSLNRDDIQSAFNMAAATDAIRDAYIAQAQSRVQAPDVTYLGFPTSNGDCHVKSGHIEGSEGFVIKIATGFYDNPAKGLPSSNGMNVVFSAETGETLALLKDEGWLTDIRTGIGGALATEALARPGFSKVLIVGAGLQCLFQARALVHLMAGTDLDIAIWARDSAKAQSAVDTLQAEKIAARAVEDLRAATSDADVILTTTPSRSALVRADWVSPGTHITAIGADTEGKQELDPTLVANADLLVCDLAKQSLDHGEFQSAHAAGQINAADVVVLGDVLAGVHHGRSSDNDITIADLTGIAAQDAAVSLSVIRAVLAANSSEEEKT